MYPVSIKVKQAKDIYIKWDDGNSSEISLMTFRQKQGKEFIPIFNENQLKIANIQQIGSYAIQISWSDGHNTGIYEFPFLKNLGSKN